MTTSQIGRGRGYVNMYDDDDNDNEDEAAAADTLPFNELTSDFVSMCFIPVFRTLYEGRDLSTFFVPGTSNLVRLKTWSTCSGSRAFNLVMSALLDILLGFGSFSPSGSNLNWTGFRAFLNTVYRITQKVFLSNMWRFYVYWKNLYNLTDYENIVQLV